MKRIFDASTQCFFCGEDNSEQMRGYGGERGCDHCGQGGQGEPDLPQMAYRHKIIMFSSDTRIRGARKLEEQK